MSSVQAVLKSCCLLLLFAAQNCHGFTTSIASHHIKSPPHQLCLSKQQADAATNDDSQDESSSPPPSQQQQQPPPPSSDLKALLPKPASRPLKMDKFGRRIFRMEDDTTVRHTKGSGSSSNSSSSSSDNNSDNKAEGTITAEKKSAPPSTNNSNLSNLLSDTKQLAGDKSLAQQQSQFENVIQSTDLKALLPTAKMRFMKLDKFGRRVQRMEDDGTVSYSRGSVSGGVEKNSGEGAIRGVKGSTEDTDAFSSDGEVSLNSSNANSDSDTKGGGGQSLSKLIETPTKTSDLQKDASTTTGIHGTDLKALLPTTKMRFMKLDKFGRRVQRMEDDGTVSYSRGGGDVSGEEKTSSAGGKQEGEATATNPIGNLETESTIDLGTRQTSDSHVNQRSGSSVNLKDLAGVSKRPVFTKLDFKGGSVEDDRRRRLTSSSSSSVPSQVNEGGEGASSASSGLKELALSSKRPIFTKLDFKGGSVVDERRAKKKAATTTSTVDASSTKSNLKDLLPTRPTFTKLDFKGGNVEDERRTTKKQPDQDYTKHSSSGSLQSLLPERKFMWKKQERRSNTNDFIGSVGGDFIARTTTAGSSSGDSVREAKQKAMRDEVIASATAVAGDEEDDESDGSGDQEEEGSYSNLTDLLPQKKFVFRDTK